jgi:hypothetical protein
VASRATLLALALTLLSACTDSSKPPEPPEQRVETPVVKGGLKPVGAGLYYLGEPRQRFPFIDHAVLSGAWEEFERRPGDFSGPGWKRIDAALRDHPTYKFRLRIMAGRGAPGWVKQRSGGCVPVVQPLNEIRSCVPRFWTDVFLDAYERLMAEVARRYDREPRVLDVVNSACTTTWAEPFIRSGANRSSNLMLWEAGLNETSDRHCFERSMQAMDQSFRSTRISLATHTMWQLIVGPDVERVGMRPSWPKEREMLNELRARYGAKLVVQNNGLGGSEGCAGRESLAEATSMWCWLVALPPPKGFQTEGDRRLASKGFAVDDAIRRALSMRGCFVEHNQFGDDAAMAAEFDRQLKANCAGA